MARAIVRRRTPTPTYDGIHYDARLNPNAGGRCIVKVPGSGPRVGVLTDFFTFTGGNQSLYRGAAGLLVQSVTNTPRIEYDAGGNLLGLLIEGARTNSILQSQTFGTTWTTGNASISSNQIAAPDGTATADSLIEDSTAATNHYVTQGVSKAASAIQYTASVWIKGGTKGFAHLRISNGALTNGAGIGINLTTGALGTVYTFGASPFTSASATVAAYASGWYRVSVTATSEAVSTTLATTILLATGTTSGDVTFDGGGSANVYVWGAQLETPVAFPSSYIPTTTVGVARTVDVCTRTVGAEVSITAGTIFGQFDSQAVTGGDAALAYIDDVGTSANRVILKHFNGRANGVVRSNGVDQADMLSANAFTANVMAKSAMTYALNDFAVLQNGQAVVADSSGSVPISLDRFRLGNDPIAAINLFGHIRRLSYWPERKTNADLQRMTA